nr:RICIN domain-containing protein [Bifidobacterium sp. ESL0745]
MTNKVKELAAKVAAILASPALGLALTAVPAQAATDTNLSGFNQAGIGSATSGNAIGGQQIAPLSKTIGNQSVSTAAASKGAMPDNPSQKLPDKVSAAVPDDATVVSKNLAVTADGQVKNLQTGKPVTDPKLVGTQDQQPDPLAKTGGKRFIPVEASEVKQAVQKNGGDANATDSGSSNGLSSSKVSGASDVEVASKSTSGTVRNVALQNNQYGAYWGWWNNTPAFFERGGNLFAQQAKGVVDVSEHQGVIDWQAAKNSGVEGAIIRIAFGWNNRYDYQALRNINECKRLGIPFGIYLYSYAYDHNSAWAEGADTVNKLRAAGVSPGDLSYPVFYDLENWTWTGHSPATNPWVNDDIVKTWWVALLQGGYHNLSVYSYTYYLNTALNTPDVRNNTRWVASYGARTNFPFFANYRGWQYADNGWINGIGNVDINAFGNLNYVSFAPNISQYRMMNIPDGRYFINTTLRDSSALDIPSGTGANGARPRIWPGNRAIAQQYQLTRQSDGSYEIRNVASGKALDVPSGRTYNGAPVQQFQPIGGAAQHWFLRDTGKGGVYIQSAMGNWMLDVPGGNSNAGTRMQLWEPTMATAQQYILSSVTSVPSGSVRVATAMNGNMVFDMPNSTWDNGARLQVFSWNGSGAQRYEFREVGNAIYQIINVNSGKALDVPSGNAVYDASVQQFDAIGGLAQHWAVRQGPNGQYAFYSACAADLALDLPAGNAFNGARLRLWGGNGAPAQQWIVNNMRSPREELNNLAAQYRNDLPDGTYNFAMRNDGTKMLDVAGGSTANGARISTWYSNGLWTQQWKVRHDAAGYVSFVNPVSGKALDVPAGRAFPGASLELFTPNQLGGGYAQKWVAIRDGNSYKLVSALNPSLNLEVGFGSVMPGAKVQLYTENGNSAQRWIAR